MKICMTCKRKATTLEIDDDGLYFCYDCSLAKELAKMNREYYGW